MYAQAPFDYNEWTGRDLNSRLLACKASDLPADLPARSPLNEDRLLKAYRKKLLTNNIRCDCVFHNKGATPWSPTAP